MKYRFFFVVLAMAAFLATGRAGAVQQQDFAFDIFERYLESLVPHIGMPGLSAAIVQNGSVVKRYNIGYADLEQKIRTRSDTPYPIGGITQAMTGVLHGVCIDRNNIDVFNIDRDIRLLEPAFPVAQTSVRQVLSHSTDGKFQYDPRRFSYLTSVVESPACLNKQFRQAMAAEVIDRMVLTRTVPGMDIDRPEGEPARALFDGASVGRYRAVLRELAVPYKIDIRGRASRSEYPSYGLDASTGMVSTVDDLAKFEIQLDSDDGHPLSSFTLGEMWSNQVFDLPVASGTTNTVRVMMPTGLGWFVTKDSGIDLVWTFGHIPDAASALIVKLPAKKLTLIMLANSGGLASGYDLENANVTSSPFVKVFLRLFI